MTNADDRLKALFATDEPPARDPAFAAAVMERLAHRRWLEDMGVVAGISVVGALALGGLWPVLEPALVSISSDLAPAALGLALALCTLGVFGGREQTLPSRS